MSAIKSHRDRSRGPVARAASRARKRDRAERERLANAAERAYVRLLAGESVIAALAASSDPYPDWVVERGPRGGVQWNRA